MNPEDIKAIVIHCSATRPDQKCNAKVIDEWHRKRGWRKIGYHYVINRNGVVEKGREENEVGAHTLGHNRVSLGICLVGGLDYDGNPSMEYYTAKQFDELAYLLWNERDGLMLRYPEAEILGHRDLSPDKNGDGVIEPWEWVKDCPCFDVREWVAEQMGLAVQETIDDEEAGSEEAEDDVPSADEA